MMEYINQLNNIIPPFVAFFLGSIGSVCFIVLIAKRPKSYKARAALTVGYGVGMIGFIPFMTSLITG